MTGVRHKGTEFNNVQETWNQNEKRDETGADRSKEIEKEKEHLPHDYENVADEAGTGEPAEEEEGGI